MEVSDGSDGNLEILPSQNVLDASGALFLVRVNVRRGVGTRHGVVMTVTQGDAFTIIETEKADDDGVWGKLKSGAGWINVSEKYCRRV